MARINTMFLHEQMEETEREKEITNNQAPEKHQVPIEEFLTADGAD
jgi:hypothetical protein